MNCSKCYAPYDEKAQYCSQCGTQTIYNVQPRKNSAITSLWLYIGFVISQALVYKILQFVTRRMYDQGGLDMAKHVNSLYMLTGVATTITELAILGYIIYAVKNTSARIAIVVFTVFTGIMFMWDIAMRLADGHWF